MFYYYRNRERNKIQAREYLRQGNNSKARECFQKCVDVTSTMALELMKVCRARNIDCIVAPYEADAQLAYLAVQGKFCIACIFFYFNYVSHK